jgi:hypothetical protein
MKRVLSALLVLAVAAMAEWGTLPLLGQSAPATAGAATQAAVVAWAKAGTAEAKFVDGLAVYIPAQNTVLVMLTTDKIADTDAQRVTSAAPADANTMLMVIQRGKPNLKFRVELPADAKSLDSASSVGIAITGLESAPANVIAQYPKTNPNTDGDITLAGKLAAGEKVSLHWTSPKGAARAWDVSFSLPLKVIK